MHGVSRTAGKPFQDYTLPKDLPPVQEGFLRVKEEAPLVQEEYLCVQDIIVVSFARGKYKKTFL